MLKFEAKHPPNSIYVQLDQRGKLQLQTFYNEKGQPFSRQDFNHPHGDFQPHEHNFSYNSKGQPTGKNVIPLSPGYLP